MTPDITQYPGNQQLTVDQLTFLGRLVRAVEAVAAQDPEYPLALKPVAAAQVLLESAWGTKHLGEAHNYLGIKARADEPFVLAPTKEFLSGKWVNTNGRFRAFTSLEDCLAAHAELVLRRCWRGTDEKIYAAALQYPTDPLQFAAALGATYATDPKYGRAIISIMTDRGLCPYFGCRP